MRIYLFILLGCFYSWNTLLAQTNSNNAINKIYQLYLENNDKKEDTLKYNSAGFYKNYIAKQISANCEFESSCSEFMSQAIQNYGSVKGFLLGIDRITRCGASHQTYNFLPSLISKNESTLIDEILFYD